MIILNLYLCVYLNKRECWLIVLCICLFNGKGSLISLSANAYDNANKDIMYHTTKQYLHINIMKSKASKYKNEHKKWVMHTTVLYYKIFKYLSI